MPTTPTPTPTPTRTPTPTPTPAPVAVYASTNIFDVNIATLKNLASDWTVNHQISVEFKVTAGGQQTAGLLLNYLPNGTYVAVVADVNNGLFSVIRYNGSSFVNEFSMAFADFDFAFDLSKWYRITVTPTVTAGSTAVSLFGALSDVAGAKTISFSTALANYGSLTGTPGIFAAQTYAYFNKFTIT